MEWERDRKAGARVSVLLHPRRVGPAPLRLREIGAAESTGMPVSSSCDTNASRVSLSSPTTTSPPTAEVILSRAQRAHSRLSWAERLARNARGCSAAGVAITLFGVPGGFAAFLGLSPV